MSTPTNTAEGDGRSAQEPRGPARRGPTRLRTVRWSALPWGAAAVLVPVGLAALFPRLLAPEGSFAEDVSRRLLPPSAEHLFGTDELGRDLLGRVVHGAQTTLTTALLALGFALVLSLVTGVLAGYLGGLVDRALMAVVDVLLALPSLLISLLIVFALGTGPVHLAVAVGIASVPAFARVTRAEVLRVSSRSFVEAARGYGLPLRLVLVRHVLPHARGPITALGALELATIVLSVSALSFLGYGAQPPNPEWGNLISEGRSHFMTAWWLTALPGAVLVCLVLALHRVGRLLGAREAGGV